MLLALGLVTSVSNVWGAPGAKEAPVQAEPAAVSSKIAPPTGTAGTTEPWLYRVLLLNGATAAGSPWRTPVAWVNAARQAAPATLKIESVDSGLNQRFTTPIRAELVKYLAVRDTGRIAGLMRRVNAVPATGSVIPTRGLLLVNAIKQTHAKTKKTTLILRCYRCDFTADRPGIKLLAIERRDSGVGGNVGPRLFKSALADLFRDAPVLVPVVQVVAAKGDDVVTDPLAGLPRFAGLELAQAAMLEELKKQAPRVASGEIDGAVPQFQALIGTSLLLRARAYRVVTDPGTPGAPYVGVQLELINRQTLVSVARTGSSTPVIALGAPATAPVQLATTVDGAVDIAVREAMEKLSKATDRVGGIN